MSLLIDYTQRFIALTFVYWQKMETFNRIPRYHIAQSYYYVRACDITFTKHKLFNIILQTAKYFSSSCLVVQNFHFHMYIG